MNRSNGKFYIYLLPMLFIMSVVYFYPLISIINFSLRQIRGFSGPFIGLANYRFIFGDPIFTRSILNNLSLFLVIPLIIFFSIIIAAIIYDRIKGWKFYRVAIFMPYVMPITVVGIVFGYIFTLNGVLNELLKMVHLDIFALDWLGNPKIAIFTIMFTILWKETGFGIMLFLARLMSVDEELYEAARIDGANWWQRLIHVTIPQLYTIIEFFGVLTMINMLGWVFAYSYTVTNGGPGTATYVMEMYIYNRMIKMPRPGISSAASVMLLVFATILIILFFRIKRQSRLEDTI